MSFETRCFGVLERRKIRLEKLFGSGSEEFDWSVRIEGNAFNGFTFSSTGLEDTVLQVDRSLPCYIVRVHRHIALRATIFDPANRAVMMSLCAGHPDIAVLAMDPGACVTDRPVIRRCVRIEIRS